MVRNFGITVQDEKHIVNQIRREYDKFGPTSTT